MFQAEGRAWMNARKWGRGWGTKWPMGRLWRGIGRGEAEEVRKVVIMAPWIVLRPLDFYSECSGGVNKRTLSFDWHDGLCYERLVIGWSWEWLGCVGVIVCLGECGICVMEGCQSRRYRTLVSSSSLGQLCRWQEPCHGWEEYRNGTDAKSSRNIFVFFPAWKQTKKYVPKRFCAAQHSGSCRSLKWAGQGPHPGICRGASQQNYSGTRRVKGVPLELLLSPVTQASVSAAEHCLVRTAITGAWQIGELWALSCGRTIGRRMPRGAYSSNELVSAQNRRLPALSLLVYIESWGRVVGLIYRDHLLPGKLGTLEIVEDCSVYRTWKFFI